MPSNNSSLNKLIEKGAAAFNNYDYKKAIEYYEKGLEISRDTEDRRNEGICIGGLGAARANLGEIRRAIEYYDQALAIAEETGNRSNECIYLGNLGGAYSSLGEIKKAINYYEQALTIAKDIGDRGLEGSSLENLGGAYGELGSGEIKKAIEYYEQALAIARETRNRSLEGSNLWSLGGAYTELGEIKKALEYHEKALRIAKDTGIKWLESGSLGGLGLAYGELGEIKKEMEYYEKALAIARETGDRLREGVWIAGIGYVNLISGEWSSSLKLFSESLKIFESTENPTRQAEALKYIGELQIKSGDWDNARMNLDRSIKIYGKTTPHRIADVLVHVSELNILEDLINDASANLKNAFTIISRYELNPKKIDILTKCGRVQLVKYERYSEKENIQKAKNYLESALKLAERFQRPLEQGISLRDLGILYSKINQKEKSYNYFKKSLETFQRINARYELAKTYFEFARALAENNELTKAEEIAKICAFDCLIRSFKELEIDTYMLLGDIVWKQDNSQFGYYLEAFEKAIFNTRIYVKIFFLLIKRMKKMDKKTDTEFIHSLKTINKEIQINSFLNSLLLRIQGEDYTTEGLPDELIMELNDFEIRGSSDTSASWVSLTIPPKK